MNVTIDIGNTIISFCKFRQNKLLKFEKIPKDKLNLKTLKVLKKNFFVNQDLKILISPEAIAINTIGGVASLAQGSEPLIIRVRSDTLHQQNKGQERCVVMQPTTGEITSGSWNGSTFGNGYCSRST